MDTFINETIPKYKQLLKLTGTWPEIQAKIPYKIYTFIIMTILLAFNITILLDMFNNFKSIQDVTYNISGVIAAATLLLKSLIILHNKTTFHKLLRYLSNSSFTTHEKYMDKYIHQKIIISNRFRNTLLFFTMSTLLTGSVAALIKRKLFLGFPLDVHQKHYMTFLAAFSFQVVSSAIVAWGMPCIDGLMCTLVWIGIAQIEILNEKINRISKIFERYGEDEMEPRDSIIKRILRHCAIQHNVIGNYINLMESTFTTYCLVQTITIVVAMCFIGFSIISIPLTSYYFLSYLLYCLAAITELSLFCIAGERLTSQSETITTTCYMMKWNYCNKSTGKFLFIIMERAKRPFKISAGKVMWLSLESFMNIIKSAFSYFMVLYHLYKEK